MTKSHFCYICRDTVNPIKKFEIVCPMEDEFLDLVLPGHRHGHGHGHGNLLTILAFSTGLYSLTFVLFMCCFTIQFLLCF